jgi:hypothetical protein
MHNNVTSPRLLALPLVFTCFVTYALAGKEGTVIEWEVVMELGGVGCFENFPRREPNA